MCCALIVSPYGCVCVLYVGCVSVVLCVHCALLLCVRWLHTLNRTQTRVYKYRHTLSRRHGRRQRLQSSGSSGADLLRYEHLCSILTTEGAELTLRSDRGAFTDLPAALNVFIYAWIRTPE